MSQINPRLGFFRDIQIVGDAKRGIAPLIPIGRSSWWQGVREGRFPKPVKLGPRTTAWRAEDIYALIEKLAKEDGRQTPWTGQDGSARTGGRSTASEVATTDQATKRRRAAQGATMSDIDRALGAIPCPADRNDCWPIIGTALAQGLSEDGVLAWCEKGAA